MIKLTCWCKVHTVMPRGAWIAIWGIIVKLGLCVPAIIIHMKELGSDLSVFTLTSVGVKLMLQQEIGDEIADMETRSERKREEQNK